MEPGPNVTTIHDIILSHTSHETLLDMLKQVCLHGTPCPWFPLPTQGPPFPPHSGSPDPDRRPAATRDVQTHSMEPQTFINLFTMLPKLLSTSKRLPFQRNAILLTIDLCDWKYVATFTNLLTKIDCKTFVSVGHIVTKSLQA